MKLSKKEIEEIAIVIMHDFQNFFCSNGNSLIPQTVPIDLFAKRYLCLDVGYERLSADGRIYGITAYTDTMFCVEENGAKQWIPMKQNQVLMDESFLQYPHDRNVEHKRRFTLAHECAHQLLFQLAENETLKKQSYSTCQKQNPHPLVTAEDWNEWQANTLGAAILMPYQMVKSAMFLFSPTEQIELKSGCLQKEDWWLIRTLCSLFCVSQTAMMIRLNSLGYITNYHLS